MDRPASSPPKKRKSRVLPILRWLGFALCVGLFVHALAGSDLRSAWVRVRDIGPLVLLALVPFPFALLMDAWSWQRLLSVVGRKVSLRTLFTVRLATEAVTNSAPAGAVWADALGPILVARRTDVPATDVLATITAKRWLVVRMHGTYVALACALGLGAVAHASRGLLGSDALVPIILGSALALIVVSMVIEAVAGRSGIVAKVGGLLGCLRLARVKAWVEARQHHFTHADTLLVKLSDDTKSSVIAGWRLLGLWLFEGIETVVIMKLLGVPLGIFEILSFDAALSVVRSAAVFAPAGIGVQDVGYLAMLEAYGVPGASSVGPAFIVLKRIKEAMWMAVGFIVLARSGTKVLKEAHSVATGDEDLLMLDESESLLARAARAQQLQGAAQPPSAAT